MDVINFKVVEINSVLKQYFYTEEKVRSLINLYANFIVLLKY